MALVAQDVQHGMSPKPKEEPPAEAAREEFDNAEIQKRAGRHALSPPRRESACCVKTDRNI